MTQKDKELLMKDLCARLPYGVKIKLGDNPNIFDLEYRIKFAVMYGDSDKLEDILDVTNIKPYLFPLSSMTEAQQEEFDRIYADDMQVVASNLKNRLDGKPYERNLGHYRHIDWLNANHFDYRGLISKGLAIDATGLNIY